MEWIVRASIWGSVLCWAVGAGLMLTGIRPGLARKFWTAGVAAFGVHVVSAFEVFYHWSHATAYAETARQTDELLGNRTGFGLWLNYAFGLLWLADAAFWWGRGHRGYFHRARWMTIAIHGFFAFMIFNGAVVFVEGAARWIGIAIFVGLAGGGLRAIIRRQSAV